MFFKNSANYQVDYGLASDIKQQLISFKFQKNNLTLRKPENKVGNKA